MRAAVREVIAAQLAEVGNPHSLHAYGRAARRVVEEAREEIAACLGARPSEVVFTSGGTESNNLAVAGVARARRTANPQKRRVVVSAVEHHAVLDVAEFLAHTECFELTVLPVDPEGRVAPEELAQTLHRYDDVAVVSIMWANNEVGTVQPVAELAAVARAAGVPFHTDAVQAVGHLEVDFSASGADLLTLTGHKLGATTGVGALLVRRDVAVQPLQHGGGQERQIRSGTLNAAGIRGLAAAVRAATQDVPAEAARLAALRDALIEGARAAVPDLEVSGPYAAGDTAYRLAGNVHLRVPGCDGDSLLYLLDAAGVACSTGSACQAGVPRASHVLLAMGVPDADARGALRLSLGHTSTHDEVDLFCEVFPGVVERARRAARGRG